MRLAGMVGLWWALNTQEWIPDLVTGVVVVPALFAILVCGGPVAAYSSTRYTQVVERHGGALMAISASFAVGALIGLSILSGGPSPCDGRAWCLAVMWWAICTGAWTVLAGIWGMTRSGDSPGAGYPAGNGSKDRGRNHCRRRRPASSIRVDVQRGDLSNDVIREGHAGMTLNVGEQNDTVATRRGGALSVARDGWFRLPGRRVLGVPGGAFRSRAGSAGGP